MKADERPGIPAILSALCGFLLLSFVFVYAAIRIAMLGQTGEAMPAWYAMNVRTMTEPADSTPAPSVPPLVILDPGHGGEDGGAVSASGVTEKTLNLSLSLCLYDMFRSAGIPVLLTRTTDTGLYEGAQAGHRKMADLRNRLLLEKQYPDAVFLSVHMNSFSAERYHGMQVFYSRNDPSGEVLADRIRTFNRTYLQPENDREIKAADTSIYLLDNAVGTAVLAECGFLSNPAEAERLTKPEYREKLAAVLCASVLSYLSEADAKNQTGSIP